MFLSFTGDPVKVALAAFADELAKIASAKEEVPLDDVQQEKTLGVSAGTPQQAASASPFSDRLRRHIGDGVAGAAGFGVGYGASYAGSRILGEKSKTYPMVTGLVGMAAGVAAKNLAERRQQYIDGNHK